MGTDALMKSINEKMTRYYFAKALYPLALITIFSCWFFYTDNLYLLYKQFWPEASTMVLGAFVAGSTPLGGGAVAYPVLSKILAYSSEDARLFSIMIQSIGMTCASLLFIGLGRKIYWKEIMIAAIISLTLPILLMNYVQLSGSHAKIIFTLFELLALFVLIFNLEKIHVSNQYSIFIILFLFAFIGGLLTSIIGSGADLMLFIYLVVFKRIEPIKVIPSTVIFMSINALFSVGVTLHNSPPSPEIVSAWLAAVPVVAIAAPLGAWVIGHLPSKLVLSAIIFLVIFDLLSTAFLSNLPISVNILIYLTLAAIFINKYRQTLTYRTLITANKISSTAK